MKTRNAITKFLTTVLAVAVLCGAGWPKPVDAQTGNDTITLTTYASVGIATGEGVRLCVANPKKGGTLTLSFSFYMAHGTIGLNTAPLYKSEWIEVPAGQFRCSDVWRKDLKTEGEPQTERTQLLMEMILMGSAGSRPEDFAGSVEVLDEDAQSGNAIPRNSKYRFVLLNAVSKQVNAPIGLLPDHRLRYTVLNTESEAVSVTTYTYDSIGRRTHQTTPARLEPGECRTFDVNYDDLQMKGEEGSGRVQISSGVQVALSDASVRNVNVHVWMELVNTRTGSTSQGEYYTGTVSVSGDGYFGW